MIVLFPDPLCPTIALVLPAVIEKLRPSKIMLLRDGYEKETSQNSIWPCTWGKTAPLDCSDTLETFSIILMIVLAAA